jgi:hypothetical protein
LARSTSAPLHKQQVFAGQHGLAAPVENFQRLNHHAVVRLLVVAFSLDRHPDDDELTNMNQRTFLYSFGNLSARMPATSGKAGGLQSRPVLLLV